MAIQFPSNPGIGSVFTDTDAGFSYEWTGVVWKSFTPAASSNIRELDDISSGFDGSETTFNLEISGVAFQPISAAMLQVSLGDVIQEPTTDYSVNGSTITFSSAPTGGTSFFAVARGTAVTIDYAADGNVQTKQEFTATAGQTTFTVTGGYTAGYIDVYQEGLRLNSSEYTDTSETDIVLATGATVGDVIEVVKYNVASLIVSEGEFTNLNITGVVTASSFVGDITGGVTGDVTGDVTGTATTATNLANAANITTGTISNDRLPNPIVRNLTGDVTGDLTGDVTGTATTATNLANGANITTGTISNDRLPNPIVKNLTGDVTGNITGTAGTFTGDVSVGTAITFLSSSGAIQATSFVGDGSELTGAGATLDNDTSTNTDMFPVFSTATSGTLTTAKVSSTKLTYNPSTGKLTSTIVNSSSDENLKKDITSVESALDKVKRLRGVDYTWKETDQKGKGVIAQELQEVFPELVSEEPNGYLSVNYNGLIAVLIEAIKELSDK